MLIWRKIAQTREKNAATAQRGANYNLKNVVTP